MSLVSTGRSLPAGADHPAACHRLAAATAAFAAGVEEEDVVGDDFGGLALGAVLGGPLTPRKAAVDADAPTLGEVVAGGLGLAAEDDDVEVVGLVAPSAVLVARAAGDRDAHRTHGVAAGGVAKLGVARQAPDKGHTVEICWHCSLLSVG